MKKSYFLRKKILAVSKSSGFFLIKTLACLYKFAFARRTILFVTNNKIRTFTIGPFLQTGILLAFVWMTNVFSQAWHYDKILQKKTDEINKLRSANSYFEEEFRNVNDKLEKIGAYFTSITGDYHLVKAQKVQFKRLKNPKEKDLSRFDRQTLNYIKNTQEQLANIQSVTQARIKKIEDTIAITGLNIKKISSSKLLQQGSGGAIKEISLNDKKGITDRQGGPLDNGHFLNNLIPFSASDEFLERYLEKVKFVSSIDYLIALEKVVNAMPFFGPMENYYISSGFGSRTDPITGRKTLHQGLDFVGAAREKVISPSKGKVILAGKFNGYGNAVVIDHGFGITTRYGHLAQLRVTKGQIVNQGDIIAIQGNSGRSTGPHLHYEVRYKNIALNPRKFLEAGRSMFNDERNLKYADS
jgi:murein DD-endopeptidase MepM/ murein hydrolase activator NlpD